MATSFKKFGNQVVIASVDADKHKSLGSRFEVKGFPTLIFFKSGTDARETYSGQRTAEALTEFLNSAAGTNVRIVKPPSYVKVKEKKEKKNFLFDWSNFFLFFY